MTCVVVKTTGSPPTHVLLDNIIQFYRTAPGRTVMVNTGKVKAFCVDDTVDVYKVITVQT